MIHYHATVVPPAGRLTWCLYFNPFYPCRACQTKSALQKPISAQPNFLQQLKSPDDDDDAAVARGECPDRLLGTSVVIKTQSCVACCFFLQKTHSRVCGVRGSETHGLWVAVLGAHGGHSQTVHVVVTAASRRVEGNVIIFCSFFFDFWVCCFIDISVVFLISCSNAVRLSSFLV